MYIVDGYHDSLQAPYMASNSKKICMADNLYDSLQAPYMASDASQYEITTGGAVKTKFARKSKKEIEKNIVRKNAAMQIQHLQLLHELVHAT